MADASGQSSGLSIAVSIPQSVDATTIIQISDVHGWDVDLASNTRPRLGRGSTTFQKIRHAFSSGKVAGSGETNFAKPPIPTAWEGLTATLTITAVATADGARTVDYPIQITSVKYGRKKPKRDIWPISFVMRVVGDPVWSAGWGSLLSPAGPDKEDQEQWGGSSKKSDPKNLEGLVVRRTDLWGTLTDSDAAEQTKLLAIIAAAAVPFTSPHNYKLRSATFSRDAIDGATCVEVWGLTQTDEDVLNASTSREDDPSDLQDSETTAAFNTTPGSANISGLVARYTEFKEYNDSMTLQVKHWGRTTTQEDFEFPRSPKITDLSTIPIRSEYSEAHVTSSATASNPSPASGYKLRFANRIQMTDAGKYGWKYDLGLTTPQEDEENESSIISADVAGIDSYEIHGRIVATASTGDPSSAPSGLELHTTTTREINDNAFHRRFIYRLLTRDEEIEHRGTSSTGGTDGVLAPPTTAPSVLASVDTVSSGDTSESLLQAAMTAAQAVTVRPVRTISVTKLNKTVSLTRTSLAQDDFLIFEGTPSVSKEYLALDNTGSKVTVWDGVGLTSSTSRVYLGHFTHYMARWPLVLRRWRRATNVATLKYNSLIGCNSIDTGTGAAPGTVTVSGGAITAVATGTGGSGYSAASVLVVIVGGGGSGAIITPTISGGAVTGYTVTNGGTGYTSTPTVYVTGGANFFGIPSVCVVYRGAKVRYNAREEGGTHWVCYDYAFEVCAINSAGSLLNGNFSNGNVPMDAWVNSISAVPTIPSTPNASSIRAAYLVATVQGSTGWGVFSGQ